MIVNAIFSTAVYWSVGLRKLDDSFIWYLWYLLVTMLTNLVGFSWAQMLSAFCSAPGIAMSLWQPGVYIWSQTSDFPIQKPDLAHSNPAWILMTFSFTRWAYQALIMGEFGEGWGDTSRATIFAKYFPAS